MSDELHSEPDHPSTTASDAGADTSAFPPMSSTHPRWVLPLVGSLIVALVVCTNVGNALWAKFTGQWNQPLTLLGLNSANRYLLLTTPITDVLPFVMVATTRLLLPDPLFYLLGYLYRGKALHWARRVFPGMDPLFDQFTNDTGGFRRILDVLVLVAPNNPVCLLAGVAAMPVRRFITLNVVGTLARVLLFRALGTAFSGTINEFVDNVVGPYQKWFTIASVAAVLGYLAYQTIGGKGLIGGVEELEEELGDASPTE
ncbi:MAG: hypothetical protein ACKOYM_04735 [Actinomycetes bacterium]